MSLYTPPLFAGDEAAGWAIIDAHPFGVLFRGAAGAGPRISPLPWIADREARVVRGHLARANPAGRAAATGEPATVCFQGAHGYISPRAYLNARLHVPTWNYVFVELEGTIVPLDRVATREVVVSLCRRFEPEKGYRPEEAEPGLLDGLLDAIVGIELRISRMTTKLKLSQNRDSADRAGVLGWLARETAAEATLLHWMVRG